jgi:hypothetical protein
MIKDELSISMMEQISSPFPRLFEKKKTQTVGAGADSNWNVESSEICFDKQEKMQSLEIR